jgi:hypothetical protein
MKRTLFGALIILQVGIAAIAGSQAPQKSAESKAPAGHAPVAIRPVPAEMTRRFETYRGALQPSARAWIEQRARIEAQTRNLDLPALKSAIHQRFAGSGVNLSGADIDEIVVITLMESANDGEQDLRDKMNQMQAVTQQKQAIRQLLEEVQRDAAQNAKQNENAQCVSPLCKSLPARLANLRAAAGKLPRPVNLQTPEHINYGDLSKVQAELQNGLDSMNDMNEQLQMEVQMSMDQRSQFLDVVSNMMKTMSDSASATIANMK